MRVRLLAASGPVGLTVVSVLAYVLLVSAWSRVGMQGAASAFQRKLLCRLVSAAGHQHRAHSYLGEKLLGPGAGLAGTFSPHSS